MVLVLVNAVSPIGFSISTSCTKFLFYHGYLNAIWGFAGREVKARKSSAPKNALVHISVKPWVTCIQHSFYSVIRNETSALKCIVVV